MADIYPVTDDDLSEAELTNWLNQSNLVNYVEDGSYTPDHTNEEVTADASVAYIRDTGGDLYKVEPDQETLSFPDQAGTNYLYITFDPTAADPEASPGWEITATEGSPADPKLKRAEIDASADTDTSFNDNPDVGIDKLTSDVDADGNDITGVGSFATGQASITEVATGAHATGNTSVANSTATTISLGSAHFEDDVVADFDAGNNKITLQKSGKYLISVIADWQQDSGWSTGDSAMIRPNVGGSVPHFGNQNKIGTSTEAKHLTVIVEITNPPTDVQLEAFQDSGTSQTVVGSDEQNTRIDIGRDG